MCRTVAEEEAARGKFAGSPSVRGAQRSPCPRWDPSSDGRLSLLLRQHIPGRLIAAEGS